VQWQRVSQEIEELNSLPSNSKLAEGQARTIPSSEGGKFRAQVSRN
jgi:hypothetical protein